MFAYKERPEHRATHHYEKVTSALELGCYCCLTRFRLQDFRSGSLQWVDNGETLLCPYCEVDAVVYGEDILTNKGSLQELHYKLIPVPQQGDPVVLTTYPGPDCRMLIVLLVRDGSEIKRVRKLF